jgi:hypothetical protein
VRKIRRSGQGSDAKSKSVAGHRGIDRKMVESFGQTHVATLVHEPEDEMVSATTDRERVDEQTLQALAVSRATGAPWLACMLRVKTLPVTSADVELQITSLPSPFSTRLGVLDMAMLADLASGAALRTPLGNGLIMPTLTLSSSSQPDGRAVICQPGHGAAMSVNVPPRPKGSCAAGATVSVCASQRSPFQSRQCRPRRCRGRIPVACPSLLQCLIPRR